MNTSTNAVRVAGQASSRNDSDVNSIKPQWGNSHRRATKNLPLPTPETDTRAGAPRHVLFNMAKMKSERNKKAQDSKQSTVPVDAIIPMSEQQALSQSQKFDNRVAFNVRVRESLPPTIKTRSELSPFMDKRKNQQLSPYDRIYQYSKKHKCPHGRQFNVLEEHPSYYVPLCDHEFERISTSPVEKAVCAWCGRDTISYERLCECAARSCERCKANFYEHPEGWRSMDKHQAMYSTVLKQIEIDLEGCLRVNGKFSWKLYDQLATPERWLRNRSLLPKQPERKPDVVAGKTYAQVVDPTPLVANGATISTATGALHKAITAAKQLFRTALEKLRAAGNSVKDKFQKFKQAAEGITILTSIVEAFWWILENTPIEELVTIFLLLKSGGSAALLGGYKIIRTFLQAWKIPYCWILNKTQSSSLVDFYKKTVELLKNQFSDDKKKPKPTVFYDANDEVTINLPTTSAAANARDQPLKADCDATDAFLAIFATLPGRLGKLFGKSIITLCKEVMPLLSVTKITIDLGTKLWSTITKCFKYWAPDSRSWLAFEMKDKTSHAYKATAAAFDYHSATISGDANKQVIAMSEYTVALPLFTQDAKDADKYDGHFCTYLKHMQNLVSGTRAPQSRKHEPFGFYMYGDPGAGKSTGYFAICAPTFGVKTKEEFDDISFCRGISEYWDGIASGNRIKPIIVYDDFNMDRKEEADVRELITLISAAPFFPNFASLTGPTPKGTTISPDLVIMCSNQKQPEPTFINEKEALYRRMTLRVEARRFDKTSETVYRVDGGAMTKEYPHLFHVKGSAAVTRDDYLSLTQMQELFALSFGLFMSHRKERLNVMDVKAERADIKPVITYSNTGVPTINTELLDKASHFADTAETFKLDMRHNPVLTANFGEISGKDVLNAFLSQVNNIGYHAYFFASMGAFAACFKKIMTTDQSWMETFGTVIKYSLIPATVALIWLITPTRVEANSATHKGKAPAKQVQANSASTSIDPIIERNMINLSVWSGTKQRTLNGIFVGGTTALIPEHLFLDEASPTGEYHRDGTPIYVRFPYHEAEVLVDFRRLSVTKLRYDNNSDVVDMVLYEFPANKFTSRRNITKFFWDGKLSLDDAPGRYMDYVPDQRPEYPFQWYNCKLKSAVRAQYTTSRKTYAASMLLSDHIGRVGGCGNPVLDARGYNAPIVGLHIASMADGTSSRVLIITKSMIERGLKQNTIEPRSLTGPFIQPLKADSHEKGGASLVHGEMQLVATLEKRIFTPSKTTLRPSAVHDQVFEHITEPAALHNKDPRIPPGTDLFWDGIHKMSKRPIPFDPEKLAEVKEDMREFYRGLSWSGPKRPLHFHEVLNVTQEWPHLNGLEMSTSAGYPYVLQGRKRKDLMLLQADGWKIPTFEFFMDVYADILLMTKKTAPEWYYVTSLKDERRPLDKIYQKAKTRLFSVCSVKELIVAKMLYAPFMSSLLQNPRLVRYAGGVDRQGASWDAMMLDLLGKSTLGFGGDYEWYDGRLEKQVMESSLDLHVAIDLKNPATPVLSIDEEFAALFRGSLTDTNQISLAKSVLAHLRTLDWTPVHETMKQIICEPHYMFHEVIILILGSLASGVFVTQTLGTLSNETFFRLAWNDIVPPLYRGGKNFQTFVGQKIMSDDNINAIHEELIPYFNAKVYAEWCEQHGMKYTSADKKGEPTPIQPIEEVSFLKNTTGSSFGYRIPLMEIDAAIEPLNWVREAKDMSLDKRTEINVNCVLRTLFFHGPALFNQLRDSVLALKPSYSLYTYGSLKLNFLTYGKFPGAQSGEPSFYDFEETPLLGETDHMQLQDPHSREVSLDMATSQKLVAQADDKTTCPFCGMVFHYFNRMLDHIYAKHQKINEVPMPESFSHERAAMEWLCHCNIDGLRKHYSDLQLHLTSGGQKCELGNRMSPAVQKATYHTLGNLINFVKSGNFADSKKIGCEVMIVPEAKIHECWQCSDAAKTTIAHDTFECPYDERTIDGSLETSIISTYGGEWVCAWCERVGKQRAHQKDFCPFGKRFALKQERKLAQQQVDSLTQQLEQARLGLRQATLDETKIFANAGETDTGLPPVAQDAHVDKPTASVPISKPAPVNLETKTALSDPYNESMTEGNQFGYTMGAKEEVETVSIKVPVAGKHLPIRAELSMNDMNWTLEKMLARWNQVGVYAWTTAQAPSAEIFTWNVIEDLIANTMSSAPFELFQNFRCSRIRIRIVLVASKFHQGRLVLGMHPIMVKDARYPEALDVKQMIEMGAIQLDPTVGAEAEYVIPFRHVKGHLDLLAKDTLGILHLRVLNQLKVVTGSSTSVNVKVMFCLDDAEFKIPRPSTGTFRHKSRFEDLRQDYDIIRKPRRLYANSDERELVANAGESAFKAPAKMQASINDMSLNEATPIGPMRGKTGDPRVTHFSEKYTTWRDINKRYRLLDRFNVVIDANTSQQIIYTPAMIMRKFENMSMFGLFRGAMNFKIKLRSVETQYGGLDTVAIKFFVNDTPAGTTPPNLAYPGNELPIATGDTNHPIEVSVPFLNHSATCFNPSLYPFSRASQILDYQDVRTYYLAIETILQAAVSIEVWVAWSDEASAGVFLGTPTIECVNNGIDGWTASTADRKVVDRTKLVANMDEVGDIEDLIEPLGAIAGKLVPKHLFSDLLMAALDKPQVSLPPTIVKSKEHDYLNHAVGVQSIDKLQLYPAAQQMIDAEHFGTPADELDFIRILKKHRSLVAIINWPVTAAQGTQLWEATVGPMAFTPDTIIAGTRIPLLDFIAKNFSHWRGGITFTFDVVTSAFQEGKLEVGYHPNRLAPPASYDARVSQYAVAAAIKNSENVFAVTTSYYGETPWKRVWNGNPLHENDVDENGENVNDYYAGCISLNVANPLQAPATVVNNVDINIYMQVADDFELANMTYRNKSLLVKYPFDVGARHQPRSETA